MRGMKFISYEGPVHQMIVLFPNSMDHHTMAVHLGLTASRKGNILGAGFIAKAENGYLACIGKSIGLNVGARPEDTKLLQRMLDPD